MNKNENNKMPATVLALLGGLLISFTLLAVGINSPTDCADINQPNFFILSMLVPGILCAFFAIKQWHGASYILLTTLSVGILGFVYLQVSRWGDYVATIAGCSF